MSIQLFKKIFLIFDVEKGQPRYKNAPFRALAGIVLENQGDRLPIKGSRKSPYYFNYINSRVDARERFRSGRLTEDADSPKNQTDDDDVVAWLKRNDLATDRLCAEAHAVLALFEHTGSDLR